MLANPLPFLSFLNTFLKIVPSILQGELTRCLALWWYFCCRAWFWKAFSFFWTSLFLFFPLFSAYLIVSVFNIPKYKSFFFCPSVLMLSWFDSLIPSIAFLFPLFIISIAHFSIPNSIRISSSFSFFCTYLYVIYIHKVINLSLWFRKFVAFCVFPKYVVEWYYCSNE